MLFGYARVSTTDQNPAHQIGALVRSGVERANRHLDYATGAQASRPQLDLLLRRLRNGDALTITRLDRLGRSVVHLITLGAELRDRGVGLRVLEQGWEAPIQGLRTRPTSIHLRTVRSAGPEMTLQADAAPAVTGRSGCRRWLRPAGAVPATPV